MSPRYTTTMSAIHSDIIHTIQDIYRTDVPPSCIGYEDVGQQDFDDVVSGKFAQFPRMNRFNRRYKFCRGN